MIIGFIGDTHFKDTNPVSRKDNYMQSLLDKLEYVLQHVDYLFILGDIFDAPIVSTFCVNRVNLLLKSYEKEHKTIKLLLGNHDQLGQNKGLLPTSFGSLIIANPKRYFNQEVILDNYHIVPIIDYNNIPKCNSENSILCGHALYEIPDDYTLSESDIDSTFDYCILGHDHKPYDDIIVDGHTHIIRLGSFARKEHVEWNLYRLPCFLTLDTQTGELCKNELEVETGYNIFVEKPMKSESEATSFDLSELKNVLKGKNKLNIFSVLKDMLKVDDDIINLIQQVRSGNYS